MCHPFIEIRAFTYFSDEEKLLAQCYCSNANNKILLLLLEKRFFFFFLYAYIRKGKPKLYRCTVHAQCDGGGKNVSNGSLVLTYFQRRTTRFVGEKKKVSARVFYSSCTYTYVTECEVVWASTLAYTSTIIYCSRPRKT